MTFFTPKISIYPAEFPNDLFYYCTNNLSSLHIFVDHCTFCASLHVKTSPGSSSSSNNILTIVTIFNIIVILLSHLAGDGHCECALVFRRIVESVHLPVCVPVTISRFSFDQLQNQKSKPCSSTEYYFKTT